MKRSSSGKLLLLVLVLILSLGGYMLLRPSGPQKGSSAHSSPASQPVKVKISETPPQPEIAVTNADDSNKDKSKQPIDAKKTVKGTGKADSEKKAESAKAKTKTAAEKKPANKIMAAGDKSPQQTSQSPAVTAKKTAKISGKADSEKKTEPAVFTAKTQEISAPEKKTVNKTVVETSTQKSAPVKSAGLKKKEKRKGPGLAVQAGSFLIKKNAESRLKVLKKAGYKAYIAEADVFSKHWYRVKIGPYKTRVAAKKAAAAIRTRCEIDCIVVSAKDNQ